MNICSGIHTHEEIAFTSSECPLCRALGKLEEAEQEYASTIDDLTDRLDDRDMTIDDQQARMEDMFQRIEDLESQLEAEKRAI